MNSPYASAGAIARPQGCPDAPLHGRRLTLARVTWTAVTLLTVVLFVAGVPASFEYLQIPCAGSACTGPQPTVATIRMLGQLGIPIALYAAFVLALDVIFAVVCFAVAGLIVRHQPVSRVALLAALALLTFGGQPSRMFSTCWSRSNLDGHSQSRSYVTPGTSPSFRSSTCFRTGASYHDGHSC